MNRTTARKTAWTPGQSVLVCSCHFVDGTPTLENPYPTLKLGYTKRNPEKKTRRELVRRVIEAKHAQCTLHKELQKVPKLLLIFQIFECF